MTNPPEEIYQLEKSLWTDSDFDIMGWHDSLIFALRLDDNYEFILDIDYIFKWVHPTGDNIYFKFWVAPCTLVFENVYDLKIDIQVSGIFELEIGDIHRNNPTRPQNADFIKRDTEYDWTIELQQGAITFKSVGYKQYVRQIPILLNSQTIELEKRKGISFDRQAVLL